MRIPAWRRPPSTPPVVPVYADSRVAGFTLTFRMKALIASFLLVVGLIVSYVFQRATIADERHRDNVAAQARTAALIAQIDGFSKRLDATVETNMAAIRELACIIVSQTPDDPKKPVIHEFRVKYQCPAYDPKRPPLSVPPATSPRAQGPSPGSGGSIPPRAGPGGSPTATGPARPVPSPNPSPTPGSSRTCVLTVCLPPGLPIPSIPLPTIPLGLPRPF